MSTVTVVRDDQVSYRFEQSDFVPAHLAQRTDCIALDGGRGAAWRVKLDGQVYVLRHYLRGGLMAPLLTDRYLWLGLNRTRPMREWAVVSHALEHELMVPPVVAVRVERSGLFYRAAIMSRFIENRGTLASLLLNTSFDVNDWQQLGQAISAMHQAGVDHADLNANNLLYTIDGKWCLLDFDKAVVRSRPDAWAQKNLDRLLRSLRKIKALQEVHGGAFHFSDEDWQSLVAGYSSVLS